MAFQVASIQFEEEYEEEIADKEEEEVSEQDLQFVRLVQANEVLWKKDDKDYKNIALKGLTWETIGQSLPQPMSGPQAEKKFKGLRTVFARYNKMVRESEPRSGSGADTKVYIPTWPLYKEMTFLTDVIKPRGTKTNFTQSSSCSALPSSSAKKPRIMRNVFLSQSSSGGSQSASDAALPSTSQQSLLEKPNGESPLSAKDVFLRDVLAPGTPDSDCESSISSVSQSRTPTTPAPDKFYRLKRQEDSACSKSIVDMAGALKTFIAMKTKQPPASASQSGSLTPEVEGAMLLLRGSLGRIHPSLHLECVMQILNILKTFEERSRR